MSDAFLALGKTPYERLKNLMARLRTPETGCPWDVEQTFETIAPYTIEEAYEVADAISKKDMASLKEELGDLMFQVVFHAQMADETNAFDLDEVCDSLTRKMVRRHPHVFGDADQRQSAEAQTIAWEDMKAEERQSKSGTASVSLLDDVAISLPALMRAEKLQKRAARVGFDWPSLDGVIEKIVEEAREVADAAESGDPDHIQDEVGDLIFAVANLARKLDIDPEEALRQTNSKFTRRFQFIEKASSEQNRALSDWSLDEMEAVWVEAKNEGL